MHVFNPDVKFDSQLISKYDKPTPRYTSYPPATELSTDFNHTEFHNAIALGNQNQTPLSLYFHVPFCESACYFCGCNVIITQKKELVVEPYLDYLYRNIEQVASLIDRDRKVVQLHWGGGTPNYLMPHQAETLWTEINRHFTFDENAEISLEINPRYVDRNYIFHLRNLGFNRISFGIQDFHPQVQEAVNRVQPEKMLFQVMEWIREAGFESVNVDLIYGLPFQNLQTFTDTVEKTLQLSPDRIAVFNFAYLPALKPVQKNISPDALPGAAEKLDILQMTIEKLTGNGYQFIGMDHFAKDNDELAIAQREQTLHRNFQGYTTKAGSSDLFGFGLTSISMLDSLYVQNHKGLKDYYRAIDQGNLPIAKGVVVSAEDRIRREVIMELMCHFTLDKTAIAQKYNLDFDKYFDREKYELELLEADGLVRLYPDEIEVTPTGRLLIRNIASIFDGRTRDKIIKKLSKSI
ncbi:oxygen-independent coproporphyrinogen III oxidase [Phormidium sp. CCY1219]|nr:oxygen-independent coproporphyrinogen III oxidase [Phormidium sp. CCY1219]MEB3831441.1 oxygen-independent coproporphyrinogen III oxidase [Phormidium sp. CCY1219]